MRVTNWPISKDVNVWWNYYMTADSLIKSPVYNASGFGHLHILVRASALTGQESVKVIVFGMLWNAGHTMHVSVSVYTITLKPEYTSAEISIPVPSEEFRFEAITDATTVCYVSLSFYLTWA